MGTTAEKLAKLEATKADIKQSIIDKGVSVPSDATFASYADYIDQITGGGGMYNVVSTPDGLGQQSIDIYDAAGGNIEPLSVTVNGTYTRTEGGYNPVTVNVTGKPEETFDVTPSTSQQTITPTTGYVFSSGVVRAMPTGALSAADSTLSGASFTPTLTYNSTNGNYVYGGSANATGTAHAKVTTNGYLSSSNNTSKSLSAAVSATGTLAKVAIKATNSGKTSAVTPVISKQSVPSGVTDASSGDATTTAPSSGVYVAVKSAANTGTLTSTPTVVTAGYGTTTSGQYTATNATSTVGANASATTYVPIKTGSAATPATTKQQSAPTFSLSGTTLTASVAATSVSVTPTISAGYITTGTAGTITMSANSATYTIPTETKTATDNGTVTPTSGKFLSSVTVNVPYTVYRTGSGAPSSSLGNNGDIYVDLG